MDETLNSHARDQLLQRRRRLETVRAGEPVQVERLIGQVDAALERIFAYKLVSTRRAACESD